MADTFTFTVPLSIPRERVAHLLCSAFEGGSNYWYVIEKFVEPPKLEFTLDKSFGDPTSTTVYKHIDYPLNEGGAVVIRSSDRVKNRKIFTLDLPTITKGIQLFAEKGGRHFADFLDENDDAETGDVFLQYCLFGEIVFG